MSNNQGSNFSSNLNTFIQLAGAAFTLYQVGSSLFSNSNTLDENSSANSRANSNHTKKCDLCKSEIRSSFMNRFENDSFTCSICRNHYHKDCFSANKIGLAKTLRCPKCNTLSLK